MKTLEEIKEEYAKSLSDCYETYNWQSLISGNGTRNMEHHHDAVAKLYAKEVAKEALKNASERARLHDGVSLHKEIQYIDEMGYDVGVTIDKQSILNESNIPKL